MATLNHEWCDRLPTVAGTNEPIRDGEIFHYSTGEYDEHPGDLALYWRDVERGVVYPIRAMAGGGFGWWVTFEQYARDGKTLARKLYAEGTAKTQDDALRAADETATTFERIWNRG